MFAASADRESIPSCVTHAASCARTTARSGYVATRMPCVSPSRYASQSTRELSVQPKPRSSPVSGCRRASIAAASGSMRRVYACPDRTMGGVGPRVYDRRMLRRLRIENLVLIREAELELAPGLNAITGETGAGKTILAQAFGLLLGAKGDSGYIGAGADEAYVEAELELPEGFLDEEGLEVLAEL